MVCFLYLLGVEYPSRRVIACVVGLSVFTAVASAGEVNFNVIGVSFMAAASCSDAVRLVVAQKLLKNLKMQPMETLYLISPICIMWMVLPALVLEVPSALHNDSFSLVSRYPLTFIASGFSGCFVNLTSFLFVRRTSSMTLKILTMARNGGLVIASAVMFGEEISALEAFGYSGLLVCFGLYTYVKANEATPNAGPKLTKAAKPVSPRVSGLDPCDDSEESPSGESNESSCAPLVKSTLRE